MATSTIARSTTTAPPTQRVMLTGVRWETYEALLRDHLDRGMPHFTYDRGVLEIMSPSLTHEEDNRTIALLVEIVAEELDVDVRNVGSLTFKRRDLERGFEPDTGFYLQRELVVRGLTRISLGTDPPPDLLIEIEVSQPTLPKLPIYAEVGVPEVWTVGGARVQILGLADGLYLEMDQSVALPVLTATALSHFLRQGRSLSRTAWLRELREWVRAESATD